MKPVSIAASLSLFVTTLAFARTEVLSPLKVESDVPTWKVAYGKKVEGMKAASTYPENGYTECREIEEVAHAFLCLSNTQRGMNSTLGRASFFVEGIGSDHRAGDLVREDDSTYQNYKTLIGGHDLKGADLLRFDAKVKNECASSGSDANVCYNLYEKDFFESFVVPQATAHPDFVVITFADKSSMGWQAVVTHEVMHAQYFNQSTYRSTTDAFWANEVTAEDKARVRELLGTTYDSTDEFLMKNEFQAYILMSGAESSELRELVGKYRSPLQARLRAAGVEPVQIRSF